MDEQTIELRGGRAPSRREDAVAVVRQLLQQGVAVERAAEGAGFASARDMRRVWHKFESVNPGQLA